MRQLIRDFIPNSQPESVVLKVQNAWAFASETG